MDTPKLIQVADDAISVVELGESNEDTLNEVRVIAIVYTNHVLSGFSQIALNINKSHLAFSMDSGVVGVVDLSTKAISRMKTKHESVCIILVFRLKSSNNIDRSAVQLNSSQIVRARS
jgi:hypothetical protein